jgi:hypothetical protein
MRILLLLVTLSCSLLLGAQTIQQRLGDSSYLHHTQTRKWSVTRYSSIGVGVSFFNGRSATIASAPVGLQLNRRLNDNLYAFTGVSLVPAYISFNRPFPSMGIKSYSGNNFKSSYFGVNPSVNMGLMYVNDARTFSISGSVGIQKSNDPLLFYSPANMQRTAPFPLTPFNRSVPIGSKLQ